MQTSAHSPPENSDSIRPRASAQLPHFMSSSSDVVRIPQRGFLAFPHVVATISAIACFSMANSLD